MCFLFRSITEIAHAELLDALNLKSEANLVQEALMAVEEELMRPGDEVVKMLSSVAECSLSMRPGPHPCIEKS